jgi:hypothetical protein
MHLYLLWVPEVVLVYIESVEERLEVLGEKLVGYLCSCLPHLQVLWFVFNLIPESECRIVEYGQLV